MSSYWLVVISPWVSSLKSATLFPLSSSSSSLHLCLVMRRSPGTCRALAGFLFLPFPARRSLDLTHSPAHTHTTISSEKQQRQVVPGACDASSEPGARTKMAAEGSHPVPCPRTFSDAIREKKQRKKPLLSVTPSSFRGEGEPCRPPGVTSAPAGLHG